MQRHHEVALYQALDQLYLQGATSILKEQLYIWFDADRLTKGVYREIVLHWKALCKAYRWEEEEIPELDVLDFNSPMLNIRRREFDGEEIVPMASWT